MRDEAKKRSEAPPQMKDLGELWNKADAPTKEDFIAEAENLKKLYDEQMKAYKSGSKRLETNDSESGSDSDIDDVAPPKVFKQ